MSADHTTSKVADVLTVADPTVVNDQLRLAADVSDIGWWDVDAGDGHLSWSPRVKALFGIPAEVSVTMDDFYGGLHPDDRERVTAAYLAAADPDRRMSYDVEYRTIGKSDGVIRWVAAKGRGVFDGNGRCTRVIGTAVDISKRVQERGEAEDRQREVNELREQFIAVLGHDLRNPLAAVSAATRILLRNPERAAEVAPHIQGSVSRMAELIDNILDFARGRLGGGLVATRDSDQPLEPVLWQVIEELRNTHDDLEVIVDIDLAEPVECNRPRLGQLLSNLLGNACTYGKADAPVRVLARSADGQFELTVSNSGPPIDPADLDSLFQPFFRGKVRSSREGLGLGLYICSEIAKAHDGTINVVSEGGTTSFTLRMPTK